MGIIQFAENCKYQTDGYCELNRCTIVNSIDTACPHFIEKLSNKSDSLAKACNADKLY